MSIMIRDIPCNERPRERLINYGVNNLSNEELLSIILKVGTKNKSVRDLSIDVLKSIKNITDLKDYNLNRLLSIKGIGSTKACEILAAIELGKRIFLNQTIDKNKYRNSKDIYKSMKYLLDNKKQEYFYCIYLNNKNQLLERRLLFMGTINRSIVHPREVFKYAYLSSASSIICIHNHPSGDVNPSSEDIKFTKSLVDIGKIQGIPLLDHIIVGENSYYSFSDNLEILNL